MSKLAGFHHYRGSLYLNRYFKLKTNAFRRGKMSAPKAHFLQIESLFQVHIRGIHQIFEVSQIRQLEGG